MTYERFEDLPVRQAAVELAEKVYELTEKEQFKKRYSLRDQIERASVSVSNNIADGFERGTTQELLTFLHIARGSAGEVRSMLYLIEKLPIFHNLKLSVEGISRQIRAWADSLQNSDVKGQRYLNEKGRRLLREKKEDEEFHEELKGIIDGKRK